MTPIETEIAAFLDSTLMTRTPEAQKEFISSFLIAGLVGSNAVLGPALTLLIVAKVLDAIPD
ncbi:MAG: hypothetical protein V4621_07825 [Pseudomonadota bacterium]